MLVDLGDAEKYEAHFFGDKRFAYSVHSGTASKPAPYHLTERWRVSSAKWQKLVCGKIARCKAPCSKCTPMFLLQSSQHRTVPRSPGQALSHLIIYSRLIINCKLKEYSFMLYETYFGLKLRVSLFFSLKKKFHSSSWRAVEKTSLFSTSERNGKKLPSFFRANPVMINGYEQS